MNRYQLTLGFILLVAVTLLSGWVHGRMTNRWGYPEDTVAAAAKLQGVPTQFGTWQLRSSEELSENTIKMLDCVGYFVREYVNRQTGDSVKAALLLALPEPLTLHTPEVCFSSREYTIAQQRQRVKVHNPNRPDDEFWALTFRSNHLEGDMLRVYYAWSTGDRWSAPEQNRFTFKQPYLYKIQLAGHMPLGADPETADPCWDFLQDFIPVVEPYLVQPSGE